MNFRLTAALFGIVFVVAAGLLILSFTGDKEKLPETLFPDLAAVGITAEKPEKIDTVEFERADGSAMVIARTDKDRNVWQIQKPINARADASKVMQVVTALLKAKPTPYTELSSNPAIHGLDPAGLKVTIRQGTERSGTLNLGDVTMGDKGVVFVNTASQPRPMAVRRGDLDALFRDDARGKDGKMVDLAKWTADFRTTNVFPSDSRAMGEDVTAIKLSLPNQKKELALSRTTPGSPWKFDSPAGWGDADTEGDPTAAPDKLTGVGPLLRALANVSAQSPSDFIDNPGDLKQYDLNPDNPNRIRIEMKTHTGQSAVVYLGKIEGGAAPPPPKLPGMPPHPPAAGKVYVMVEGLPGVIRASATNLSGLAALIADPNPLRDRDLIRTSAGKQVDGLDLIVAGQPPDRPTKLRKVGPEWRLYGGPGDPQKAHDPVVSRIVEVLTARRAIKDFPAPNPANFAAIAATVYVWVDGFNPPIADKAEPAKKNEPVKIEFGRKEGETIYVRRTLPAVLLGTDVLQAVTKTRLDLLDQTLPSFSDTMATKVTVTGTNTYTLVRDEKPDPLTKLPLWRFTAPDPQKGKVADAKQVENLLTLLATSQGAFGKFVDEAPNAAEYGLTPPRLKIAVSLGGKGDDAREYEFGKDTPSDPDKVYARVAGKPAVFTIQRRVLDQFIAPDLRDRMLFRQVDPAKATKVELKGWGSAGFVTDLVFERNKEGVWAVTKGPMGYALMPSKVDAFLDTIAKARVKGFVAGPVQPAHGFGDPKVNLGVTVTLPDGLVLGLNIGAETDNGASYFGWTTWASESSLLLDAAPFRDYKTSPGAFAK